MAAKSVFAVAMFAMCTPVFACDATCSLRDADMEFGSPVRPEANRSFSSDVYFGGNAAAARPTEAPGLGVAAALTFAKPRVPPLYHVRLTGESSMSLGVVPKAITYHYRSDVGSQLGHSSIVGVGYGLEAKKLDLLLGVLTGSEGCGAEPGLIAGHRMGKLSSHQMKMTSPSLSLELQL